jgi:hypothetical protein
MSERCQLVPFFKEWRDREMAGSLRFRSALQKAFVEKGFRVSFEIARVRRELVMDFINDHEGGFFAIIFVELGPA